MRANRLDKPFWASWFPVREQLLADFDPASSGGGEAVFLVDIGGNTGYDLLRLRKSLSEKDGDTVDAVGREGCLVLQDLSKVIESISEEEVGRLDEAGVRRQKHDFFMPQPIQGADSVPPMLLIPTTPFHCSIVAFIIFVLPFNSPRAVVGSCLLAARSAYLFHAFHPPRLSEQCGSPYHLQHRHEHDS